MQEKLESLYEDIRYTYLEAHHTLVAAILGANVYQIHQNKSILHILAALNSPILNQVLLTVATENLNCKNDMGSTPLHWAIVNGSAEACKSLVAAGSLVFPDGSGKSCWLLAAEQGEELGNYFEELLENEAILEADDEDQVKLVAGDVSGGFEEMVGEIKIEE